MLSPEIQIGDMAVKALPIAGTAVADAAAKFFGLTLNEWFYVAAIAYTIIQGWATIYKALKKEKSDV